MEWLARKELQLLYTNRWYNLPVSTEDMMILVIDDFLLFFLIVTLLHLSLFAVWVRHHHKMHPEAAGGKKVLPFQIAMNDQKKAGLVAKLMPFKSPPTSPPASPPDDDDDLTSDEPPAWRPAPMMTSDLVLAPLPQAPGLQPLRPLKPLKPLTGSPGSSNKQLRAVRMTLDPLPPTPPKARVSPTLKTSIQISEMPTAPCCSAALAEKGLTEMMPLAHMPLSPLELPPLTPSPRARSMASGSSFSSTPRAAPSLGSTIESEEEHQEEVVSATSLKEKSPSPPRFSPRTTSPLTMPKHANALKPKSPAKPKFRLMPTRFAKPRAKDLAAQETETDTAAVEDETKPASEAGSSSSSSWLSSEEDPKDKVRLSFKLRMRVNYLDGFSYVPDNLWWPNYEVLIVLFWAPALMQRCVATLVSTDFPSGTPSVVISFLAVFYLHEFARLFHYSRKYGKTCWRPSKKISNRAKMDDPLLKWLAKKGLAKPALRWRGEFEVKGDDDDWREPWRTARALRAPIGLRFWKRGAGDAYQTLAKSWLIDASGNKGVLYQLVKVTVQLTFAILVGIAASSNGYGGGPAALIIVMILLQFFLGFYCWRVPHAGDRLEAKFSGFEAIFTGLYLFFRLLAAWFGTPGSPNAGLTITSSVMLGLATFAALFLPFYNIYALIDRRRKAAKKKAANKAKRAEMVAKERMENILLKRRKKYKSPEDLAATRITRVAKGKVSRKKVQIQKEMVMKERHDQAMKEMKAASVITAGARGRIARKETGRARNVRLQRERDREHAASKIQSHVRGKRDRTQLNGEYDERSARAERNRIRHEREDKAARVIQNKIRGKLARRVLERKKARKALEIKSATIIESAYRAHVWRLIFQVRIKKLILVERLEDMTTMTFKMHAEGDPEIIANTKKAAAQKRKEKREAQMAAAQRITSMARGKIDRRKVAAKKAEKEAAEKAAAEAAAAAAAPAPATAPADAASFFAAQMTAIGAPAEEGAPAAAVMAAVKSVSFSDPPADE